LRAGNLTLAQQLLHNADHEYSTFKSTSGATITKLRESELAPTAETRVILSKLIRQLRYKARPERFELPPACFE
jgi:hypothetical protein